MKNLLKIVSIIGLTVITQTAYSAAVTDTFTTGDTLTAEKLNNIKNAVNDNNTRINDIALTPGPVVSFRAPTPDDDMNSSYSVGTVWGDTSTTSLYLLEDNTANAAKWIMAAAPAVKYALGGTGPAGGFVFYVTVDGLHGLEAAPEDIGGNASATLVAWGCNTTLLSGMNETGVGSGAHNTSQRDLCSDALTAAKAAAAYEFNGYTDWFLPSKDELDLMYHELADTDDSSTNSGVGDDGNPGGFASTNYWSSSQGGSGRAWVQQFANGFQHGNDYYSKGGPNRVRAVRAF
jgi:hypothetical protein